MTITTNNAEQLANAMAKHGNIDVVVCIGTDKVVCDSLGPMVGSLLNNSMNGPLYIYGLERCCLTAQNISDTYSNIRQLHPHSTILAVDAGVGDISQVGLVQLSDHGILPGLATNKILPNIGDIGIVGIVDSRDMTSFYTDSQHNRQLIQNMCSIIVDSINKLLTKTA